MSSFTRFGPKVGQIGPKWYKSGTFTESDFSTFWLIWKSPGFLYILGSIPLWGKIGLLWVLLAYLKEHSTEFSCSVPLLLFHHSDYQPDFNKTEIYRDIWTALAVIGSTVWVDVFSHVIMWIQRKSIFVRLVQELCEGLGINKEQVKLSLFSWTSSTPDPPENCHLNVKKLPKNLFSKKLPLLQYLISSVTLSFLNWVVILGWNIR